MKKKSWFLVAVVGLLGAGIAFVTPAAQSVAQGGLRIGGSQAFYGVYTVNGAFVPDPQTFGGITAGGPLNARNLGLPGGCSGHMASNPDVIVNYYPSPSYPWARFFVRSPGDTTLVINDAGGAWRCDDDSGGNLNPMIDIANPPAGQYDVWVGNWRSGATPATLYLTELSSQRP